MRTSKCTHVCMKQNTLTSLINIHTHTGYTILTEGNYVWDSNVRYRVGRGQLKQLVSRSNCHPLQYTEL